MLSNLKSETRKLLSVRTTYYLSGFALLLVLFYAGFITGYRVEPIHLHDPTYLSQQVLGAVSTVSILAAIVGLLLFAHEYRHNTIIYTLTLSKNRSRVLAAKIIVVSIFVVLFTVVAMFLSPLATAIGMHLHSYHLVHQTFQYSNLLWRCMYFAWGYAMFALIFIALIRNQIGAIVTFLILPTTIEGILSLLLKDNAKYLPFTSLEGVVNIGRRAAVINTPGHAALISLVYIIIGWAVAWVLFLRRDAN